MKLITVSGAHSGVGKTRIIERLLKFFKGWSCLKVTVLHKGNCPLGKACAACNTLTEKFFIVHDKRILEEKGKDTQRFQKAGAKEVLWLKARPSGLRAGLKKAISRFKKTKGIIIEGTSALKYLKPDLAIFVNPVTPHLLGRAFSGCNGVKRKNSILKDSAREVIKKVDLMLTL